MPEDALYERQRLITDLSIPPIATVVGAGGTGFWTAVFLAMSGTKELILVDSDVIEASNLNRLPLDASCVGRKKIEVTRDFILKIREMTRVELQDKRILRPQDCGVLRGAVFCCTDNIRSQQLVCAYCKKNALPYQRIGYDGTVLNVSRAFPLTFDTGPDNGGYTVTPSWVIPAAFAAAAGVSARVYKNICLMDDIGKVGVPGSSFIPEQTRDTIVEEGRQEILDNMCEHMPDGWGCCEDCDRGDCDSCDRITTDDAEETAMRKLKRLVRIILQQLKAEQLDRLSPSAAVPPLAYLALLPEEYKKYLVEGLEKWRDGRHEEIEIPE